MAEKKTIELEIKSNLDSAQQSVSGLRTQLRNAQAEVAILSDKFGATSKEAVNAAKKAAELSDRIGDAKSLTEAFNPDAKFKALSGSLAGVAGGFSAVTGMMGALGTESKDVEAAILKVQSAMAVASGLQTLGESIDSFRQLGAVVKNATIIQGIYNYIQTGSVTAITASTVATTAQTTAITASTVATTASSAALRVFRLALISTGIGALVIGLIALVENFDKIVNAVKDFIGATSEAEKQVERLSAAAAKSLKNNEQYLKEHGSQLDEYTKQKLAAKNEYLKLVEEDGANQRDYALELNRKLKKIDDDRLKSKKENKKDEVKTVKETNKEISEAEQKRLDEEMQSATTAIAILDELKKSKETPAQKELREYEEKKAVLLANNLDATELTNQFLTSQAEAVNASRIEELNKEKELSDKKLAIKYKALDDLQIIFGAESKIGRMALLAKQGLMAKELIMEVSKTITFSTQAAARSLVAVAEGTAQTAKIGFPQNIPMLIGYAAQAAGIYSAIKGALSSAKASGVSTPNVSVGSVGASAPVAPVFNVVGASPTNQLAQTIGNQQQQPIKAYVVSNDVTTAQSLDRNIISSASIG